MQEYQLFNNYKTRTNDSITGSGYSYLSSEARDIPNPPRDAK